MPYRVVTFNARNPTGLVSGRLVALCAGNGIAVFISGYDFWDRSSRSANAQAGSAKAFATFRYGVSKIKPQSTGIADYRPGRRCTSAVVRNPTRLVPQNPAALSSLTNYDGAGSERV